MYAFNLQPARTEGGVTVHKLIRIFIYGSLLPGEHNHHVVEPYIQQSVPGQVAGRLVDVGSYPALVRDATARQHSIITRGLWLTVPHQALSVLDELEEFFGWEELNDYDRIWVRDEEHADLEGWAYVWDSDRGFPPVEAAYWPDHYEFKRKQS